ncbi:hypothetical protein SSS_01278 [Sarcoptes scabiei]|nr:hypothetical protein SSS_01278 [Sarcoptes scabiei]
MSTIRCLELAIANYDTIKKYKHAGTLHYRCSKILRLFNADRKQIEQHHLKALEYFTRPDYEIKQRKRIDGLKISCYSSCSTWAQMTTHSQSKKSKNQKLLTTTHRHQMIENHMIEFDHEFDSDDEEIIENLIDENVPDCRNPLPFQSSTASEDCSRIEIANDAGPSTSIISSEPINSYRLTTLKSSNSVETKPLDNRSFVTMKSHPNQRKSFSSLRHHNRHFLSTSLCNQKRFLRTIEDRIESAKKLVRKLRKYVPFMRSKLKAKMLDAFTAAFVIDILVRSVRRSKII